MASGISARTVRRRLELTEFVAVVKNARHAMIDRAIGATAAAAKPAIKTLLELLNSKSETSRLGAARALLDHLPLKKFIEDQGPEPVAQVIHLEYKDLRTQLEEIHQAKVDLQAAQRAAGVPVWCPGDPQPDPQDGSGP